MSQPKAQEKPGIAFLVFKRTVEEERRRFSCFFRGWNRRPLANSERNTGRRRPAGCLEKFPGGKRGAGCSKGQSRAGPEKLPPLQDRARSIHSCVGLNRRKANGPDYYYGKIN